MAGQCAPFFREDVVVPDRPGLQADVLTGPIENTDERTNDDERHITRGVARS